MCVSGYRGAMEARPLEPREKAMEGRLLHESLYLYSLLSRLNEWELVEPLPDVPLSTTVNQDMGLARLVGDPNEEVVHIAGEHLGLPLLDRELLLDTGAMGETVGLQRTLRAMWATGNTAESPELYEALIVTPRVCPIQKSLGHGPVEALSRRGVYRSAEGEETTEHPIDIAVYRRVGQIVSEGEDSPSGVRSYAG